MSAAYFNPHDDASSHLPSVAPFRIDVEPGRDAVRVRPVGEIDIATADSVRAQIDELVTVGFSFVVLDLREVTFVDSTALHLMVELDAGSRSGDWRLEIVAGPPAVQRAFEVTGLAARLPFQRTRENRPAGAR